MHAARRIALAAAIATGVTAAGTAAAAAGTAANSATPTLSSPTSPTSSVTTRLADRRFVVAGQRAYEVGSEDGRYPAMGWHITGEMGGIWTAPLKLLDGLWFGVDGRWVGPATKFSTGYGYSSFALPATDGVSLSRTDVASDTHRAVLVALTLRSPSTRTVTLQLDAHSELMSAYPWGSTTPSQSTYNLPDRASVAAGHLVFRETGKPPVANAAPHDWAAIVGANLLPTGSATGTDFRGPQDPPVICQPTGTPPPRCDDSAFGKGAGGQLRYSVPLTANVPRTVWVTVAGSDAGLGAALSEFAAAASNPAGELAAKVADRNAIASHTVVNLPADPALTQAIQWGKQNLADLRQRATNLKVRATNQGKQYPPAVTTIPAIQFEGAGFPDYPWLFATDGEYTAFPLVASGMANVVENHLRALKAVSLALNGSSGKVVHETVTTGDVYYGLNSDPGDVDETAKFPSAVALVWRWTGDNAFRDEMYSFAKANLTYLLTVADTDKDGWPEGSGNEEAKGLGPEAVDVAAYTVRGLFDLADMAKSKGDNATLAWALQKGHDLQSRFQATWGIPAYGAYADSLQDPGNQQVFQRFWTGLTPLEAILHGPDGKSFPGLGWANLANQTLTLRKTTCYTGTWGLYEQGRPGCDPAPPTAEAPRQSSFSLENGIMATALGNYGRLAEARQYLDDNARAMLLPDEQPGVLEEIFPSPTFIRNIDQPFTTRSMVEQAWGQYGVIWPVVRLELGVDPNLGTGQLSVVPQVPRGQTTVSGRDILVGNGSIDVTAWASANTFRTTVRSSVSGVTENLGYAVPAGLTVATVTLDGHPVPYSVLDTHRGHEVTVRTTSGTHTVVVTTR